MNYYGCYCIIIYLVNFHPHVCQWNQTLLQHHLRFEFTNLLIPTYVCSIIYTQSSTTDLVPSHFLYNHLLVSHFHSIFSVLAPQLPLSFPHPFHPVNQSLTITMANKSVYMSHPCPRCGNGNYPSMRSLTIHLNTCSNRFGLLPNAKEQPSTLPTLGQRAKQILQSMKRPHISGTLPNVNHLTFLPSNALAGPASTSDDQDTLFQSDNDVTDYDVFNDHNNNDTDNPTTTASTNV